MNHQWVKVPMCRPDNRTQLVVGTIVHIWTVGPVKAERGEIYSAGAWCVRSLKTGIRIAKFSDFNIALSFARWLWRNYGDITEANIRHFHNAETPEDTRMFDEIEERSQHPTRLKEKDPVSFIRFDPARY